MFLAGAEERRETDKKQRGGWKAIAYILGNKTFERLAVFGLLANFLVYLTRDLHMDHVSAAIIVSLWFGFSNFGPLIGAFVSDAYAGRFATIAFASFFSLVIFRTGDSHSLRLSSRAGMNEEMKEGGM
ncbi:protein NRT1/ PTR FAMILY 2.13-like isoform X2 [Prosopis cineraria]|uniref:protein NRT1/ PTR FAMILY 2.13-like isoform X2 n=1 Tax=Prosopis cineraria TaxID=364024 RepID=UPI00240EBC98|nr:protein NRT1/ PTR FAMILY 2.13-like isoform X2 [Prosopis cineraria]